MAKIHFAMARRPGDARRRAVRLLATAMSMLVALVPMRLNVQTPPPSLLVIEGRELHRQRNEWELQDFKLLSNPDLAYIPEGVRAKWLVNYSELDAWSAADREHLMKGFEKNKKFVGWTCVSLIVP